MTKKYLNELTYQIIGSAIEVHKELGPGLLESVYHKCLKQELSIRNIKFLSEQVVSVNYKGLELDAELRCDLIIEDVIVVELKAVDAIAPVFEAQLLTYMKLLQKPKGILINFNCANIFKEGQKTFVNELFRKLPEE
ncbi:MAG: GxxExxY protein [Ignavibacteriaceae bacterium]|jgi:GxxExxY protein|nr:GxxExxY protein [Ignavibacteriaceae bacterium]